MDSGEDGRAADDLGHTNSAHRPPTGALHHSDGQPRDECRTAARTTSNADVRTTAGTTAIRTTTDADVWTTIGTTDVWTTTDANAWTTARTSTARTRSAPDAGTAESTDAGTAEQKSTMGTRTA